MRELQKDNTEIIKMYFVQYKGLPLFYDKKGYVDCLDAYYWEETPSILMSHFDAQMMLSKAVSQENFIRKEAIEVVECDLVVPATI